MDKNRFIYSLIAEFPYTPTNSQHILINKLSNFLLEENQKSLFVLTGYAGTGKTTIVSLFVKHMMSLGKKSVLLAPTGRAAKVFSSYSEKHAFTIHKKIYFTATGSDGTVKLLLSENKHKNTIFIVDEASMIPDNSISKEWSLFSSRNLLEDLLNYIYSGENCKLILLGDTAQLPPVGATISPALDIKFLNRSYNLEIQTAELTDVVRQAIESGILANATNIRRKISTAKSVAKISVENFNDIVRITGDELEDLINTAYSISGLEETVIITRSNKRANNFNQEIRNRILFKENEIATGDLLMIVKNNYFWIDKESKPGFLANGDMIEILRILKFEELYGFRFADVTVRLIDYPEEKDINLKLCLDTLMVDGPSLAQKDNQRLFDAILVDHEDIPSKRKRIENVKNSPYYNALQVKFGYALTCHKTQGGQWETVFVDQGYITKENINVEYYRWLYTAITRSTKKLYLLNFNDLFFE